MFITNIREILIHEGVTITSKIHLKRKVDKGCKGKTRRLRNTNGNKHISFTKVKRSVKLK